ncbi:beta-N-acetylglucosaminidase [Salegentibacter maritimus]|uniref:beta-N-acetylglucosaminidase n=1 Tax=Salegentibacter maritimus TaxID=2794347 RepID=UPI0018E42FEA|nr:beta-N-acetylglucosaminidase [Salegentibacter maritimus]MBI6116796.1 beta-N-acetylglucosaminidase domain-containing protein [Salegentibacter maritimus]
MIKYSIQIFIFLLVSTGFAQIDRVNPVPQEVNIKDSVQLPSFFNIQQLNTDEATKNLISTYFTKENTLKKGLSIRVGDVTNKFKKRDLKKVPNRPESYYIKSTKNHILVIGRDAAGAYYGTKTLITLLSSSMRPLGEIIDYPDVSSRGVVEGFYGTPWTFENRMRQIDFYGANKLNTYIYGPKDDPYHSSPNWRKPYPEKEAEKLKKLVNRANLNHVDFVWAIHPGKDIKWDDKDRDALLRKFENMYDLGVRSFAVFFDDISGKGTDPTQQANILNYLNDKFVKEKEDVRPLIMCPTEYNKAWSNPDRKYLETLGEKLDPSIEIMWTGNTVVADIDEATMDRINAKIKRKAFIWWNYPVSDYVRNHMLLGPAYGNAKTIAKDLSGFTSNPMEHAEASKIGIYGVADYTWNMEGYHPEKTWNKSLKDLMPENYEALAVFAKHNSDLGENGHRYRRKESVAFAPEAKEFLKSIKNKQEIANLNIIEAEFNEMVNASEKLLNSKDNPFLLDEIRPWVRQFKHLGKAGLSMLNMQKALQTKNQKEFEDNYNSVLKIKTEMFELDSRENQNPYQPGIKTGSLVITPMIDEAFTLLTSAYNKEFGKSLKIESNFNPHSLFTNINKLKEQPITFKNKVLSLNPPLEVITFEAEDFLGFELEEVKKLKEVGYKLEPSLDALTWQVSKDGNTWSTPATKEANGHIKAFPKEAVKFIRIINATDTKIETRIKTLRIQF